ncbi:hypothetical protein [Hyphomicrobium sp.]|jgi:hypothetical protein|uniref:hypothetical protein n=1 Tax=Hyphomicrobium sp. TaxID=82 RepID=UPI002C4F078B|nr:hypothetical protein [Hyphomicrobium sp.]HVZ03271.1 hypothetical protein [Hyphomicrobium sp.]
MENFIFRTIAPLVVLLAITGFADANEALILDNETSVWNESLACIEPEMWSETNRDLIKKLGCDRIKNCPEMMSKLSGCSMGSVEVMEFEVGLMTELAARKECAGITVARYRGTEHPSPTDTLLDSPHWSLRLTFAPGKNTQKWEMVRYENGKEVGNFEGQDDPLSMAPRLCAIIKGKGARILQ